MTNFERLMENKEALARMLDRDGDGLDEACCAWCENGCPHKKLDADGDYVCECKTSTLDQILWWFEQESN